MSLASRLRRVRADLARVRWAALLGALCIVSWSCAAQAGAQTIVEDNVSSVGSWEAPGAANSDLVPVDGRRAPQPLLTRSAAVHFVDEAKEPPVRLVANPAIHVTDSAMAPAPKIAPDPRVAVSDDSKAALPVAPADANVQVIVGAGS